MDYDAVLAQVLELLQQEQRLVLSGPQAPVAAG